MKRTYLIAALVALAALLSASVARADFMTFLGKGRTSVVRIHAPGFVSDGCRVYAGEYRVRFRDVDYLAYCVDIDAWAGSSEVTIQGPDTLRNGDKVAYLFETYAPQVSNGVEAAGLGVAIWEVLYETSGNAFDPLHGYFRISSNPAVAGVAAALLATLPDQYSPDPYTVVLVSPCKQDMLIFGGPSVPEPAALSLIAVGAAGVLFRGRRRRGD